MFNQFQMNDNIFDNAKPAADNLEHSITKLLDKCNEFDAQTPLGLLYNTTIKSTLLATRLFLFSTHPGALPDNPQDVSTIYHAYKTALNQLRDKLTEGELSIAHKNICLAALHYSQECITTRIEKTKGTPFYEAIKHAAQSNKP